MVIHQGKDLEKSLDLVEALLRHFVLGAVPDGAKQRIHEVIAWHRLQRGVNFQCKIETFPELAKTRIELEFGVDPNTLAKLS